MCEYLDVLVIRAKLILRKDTYMEKFSYICNEVEGRS